MLIMAFHFGLVCILLKLQAINTDIFCLFSAKINILAHINIRHCYIIVSVWKCN